MNQILAGIPFTRPQTNIAGWKNQCYLTPGTDFRILSPGDMFQLYRRAQSMVSRDVFFLNKRWIQRCPEIPNILGIFGVFFISYKIKSWLKNRPRSLAFWELLLWFSRMLQTQASWIHMSKVNKNPWKPSHRNKLIHIYIYILRYLYI